MDRQPLPFAKLCGSGNDFVFVDARETTRAFDGAAIRELCDRRRGIGADGLVRLEPIGPDRVRLDYFNADGSEAALCGNASLCAAAFARRTGMIGAEREEFVLLTGAGQVLARRDARHPHDPDRAAIGVGAIALPAEVEAGAIEREDPELAIDFVRVGVPHLVVRVSDPSAIDLPRRGRQLRHAAWLGAAGANVNFLAATPRDGRFAMRTFERGVEGETLACGTGTVASALALIGAGLATSPVSIASASGATLVVTARSSSGGFEDVWLAGEGRLVFRGTY
jgi:diaminopimelate epimerase